MTSCPGSAVKSTALTYVWECSYLGAVSTAVDPRYFKLPAYTLNASQTYDLAVTVTDKAGYSNYQSTELVVGQSDLVAIIDGGDRIVGMGDALYLDGTSSYDPDTGDSTGLTFDWSCAVLSDDEGACNATLATNHNDYETLKHYGEGIYEFSATIFKLYRGVWRNATASVIITVIDVVVPPVAISALTTAKSNPSDRLVLTATVGPSTHAVDTTWSLDSGALAVSGSDLADVATTSLTNSVAAGVTSTLYLVLPADTLTAGATYAFLLEATCASSCSATDGYSKLTVDVNAPPSSGTVAVTPSEGVVLATGFEYECTGWVDDVSDLPLLYASTRPAPLLYSSLDSSSHVEHDRVTSLVT